MFSDPNSFFWVYGLDAAGLASGATTRSFVATGRGPNQSTYRYNVDGDTYYDLILGYQIGNRRRYTARINETDIVANPLDTSKNIMKTSSLYVVADMPLALAPTDLDGMQALLSRFLAKPTDVPSGFSRLVGGET